MAILAGVKEGRRRRTRRLPAALSTSRMTAAAVPAVVIMISSVLLWAAAPARGDFASDQAECADSLVGLSTCLTYVEGSSGSPTPDCCSGLKQVIGRGPKCLCVLIKDRNEPQLGFKIDANRAMSLPSTCNAPVKISECIDLLKLDPNSKDAEIFKQYGNATKPGSSSDLLKLDPNSKDAEIFKQYGNATKPGSSSEKATPSGGGGSSASGGAAPAGKSKDKNGAAGISHRLGRWGLVGGGIWSSCAVAVLLSLVI